MSLWSVTSPLTRRVQSSTTWRMMQLHKAAGTQVVDAIISVWSLSLNMMTAVDYSGKCLYIQPIIV